MAKVVYFSSPEKLLKAIGRHIKKTDVVLDIGCGINPSNYFKPKIHLLLEPFQEYVDILRYKFDGCPNVIILKGKAQDVLHNLDNKSVDSIFLIDVIEHLEKKDGEELIKEVQRLARKQIIIFTPLGFMPQEYENSETDAWGLSGIEYQKHLSGWEPNDFGEDWKFYVCKKFHTPQFVNGKANDKTYGAFFAIKNQSPFKISKPAKLSSFDHLNQKFDKRVGLAKSYFHLSKIIVYRITKLFKKI